MYVFIYSYTKPIVTRVKTFYYKKVNPLSPHDALKHHFASLKTGFYNENFHETCCQHMAIFVNFSPTSNHFHPLQVENCDSNSRLVVDEDDNRKFSLKGLIFIVTH